MKFVSFNIQYGFGSDGKFNVQRIADAMRDADIIALQEVTRNLPKNSRTDLPEVIAELLPEFFHAFGAGTVTDAGSGIVDGKARMRQVEFGNMILSRHPILATRNILLPRTRTFDRLNLQRSALEALIGTPAGAIRVYSVHLDHRSPEERISQIAFLKERIVNYTLEGGAVSGGSEFGFPELPSPEDYVVMGDFNMQPEQPEYIAMAGASDLYYGRTPNSSNPTDALDRLGKRGEGAYTWEESGKPDIRQYLDYCFLSASLLPRLTDGWIDEACTASDHKPVWVELK